MAENIKPNRAAGLQLVGANQLVQQKAQAALTQIENDNTQLQADIQQIATDLAALPAADNATVKQILGRLMQAVSRNNQGLIRSNNRQKRTIQYLTK